MSRKYIIKFLENNVDIKIYRILVTLSSCKVLRYASLQNRLSLSQPLEVLVPYADSGRILERVIGTKALRVSSLIFTVTSTNRFYPPFPEQNWFETGCKVNIVYETSRLRTLKIMPRNVHEFGFSTCECASFFVKGSSSVS